MVLYLCRMCQCELHAMLCLHIGILIRLHTVELRSTLGLLLSSQLVSLFNHLHHPVYDGVAGFKSRVNAFFIGLSCSLFFYLFF